MLPIKIGQRRGGIVNIGSFGSSNPGINATAYRGSKAALHMFGQCLAEDVRQYNLTVTILAPGSMTGEGSLVRWPSAGSAVRLGAHKSRVSSTNGRKS